MSFLRQTQRQALHATAVSTSDLRRPARAGGRLVTAYRQREPDVSFGDPLLGAAVRAPDFTGGRTDYRHLRHVGRHLGLHRTGMRGSPWWTLAGVSIGVVMVGLDASVVAIANPHIAVDLHASLADLQWITDAYMLALA